MKIFVSSIIRGEESSFYKRNYVTGKTLLHFGIIALRFMLRRKVIASESYYAGHKKAIITQVTFKLLSLL